MKQSHFFHWSDYLVFAFFLVLYASIGIGYRFEDFFKRKLTSLFGCKYKENKNKKHDIEEIFLGGRKLTFLPVAASVLSSFTSAVSLMGLNAETYYFGAYHITFIFAYVIGYSIASELYMPVFYKLKLNSANQYLELRFGKITRWLTSLGFVIQMLLYTALALYAPALVFSQVSGLPFWASLVASGTVATFYTTWGGIKAVVWTDLLQVTVMLFGLFTIMITTIVKVGGASRVWEIALEGKRLQTFILDFNPFIRHSVWAVIFGGAGVIGSIASTNQIQVQRYLACRTQGTARKSILFSFFGSTIFLFILLGLGLTSYAYFHDCDPLFSGAIHFPDQLLPYLIMVIFDQIPVVRGLFLSVIFAAALSTVSSGLNGLANVIITDLIRPIYIYKRHKDIAPKTLTNMAYGFAMGIGLSVILLPYAFVYSSQQVIILSYALFGGIGGPIFTVFTLGMFFPFINQWGAVAGLISSLIFGVWLAIGSSFYASSPFKLVLPLKVTGCNITTHNTVSTTTTQTLLAVTTASAKINTTASSFNFYDLSTMYFTLACLIVGITIAVIVSAIFKFNNNSPVSAKLLAWQAVWFCRRTPSWCPPQIDYYKSYEFSQTTTNQCTDYFCDDNNDSINMKKTNIC